MRNPFYVRCYAKHNDGVWVAVCIDLCLATQGDSFTEVKSKLDSQINDYVYEALTVDRDNAMDLLNRKAPMANRIEYHVIRLAQALAKKPQKRTQCAFEELVAVPA